MRSAPFQTFVGSPVKHILLYSGCVSRRQASQGKLVRPLHGQRHFGSISELHLMRESEKKKISGKIRILAGVGRNRIRRAAWLQPPQQFGLPTTW